MIHYNRDVNLVFAGSRDGRFGIWQFPERWRSQELEDMEREYEQARKMMMKVRAA